MMNETISKKTQAKAAKHERERLILDYDHSKGDFRTAKMLLSCGHYDMLMNVKGAAAKIATAISALEWLEASAAKAIAALQRTGKKEGK